MRRGTPRHYVTQTMTESPYRRGAEDGLRFGAYLGVMFFASIFSSALPLLSVLSMAMMIAVPGIAYALMRRYQSRLGAEASFALLWTHGVMLFLGGSLVAGAALAVYMKWIEPDFVYTQLESLAAMQGKMPGTFVDTAAEMASSMIEARFIPSAISIVTEIIMLGVVTGSALTMILSAILLMKRRKEVSI